MQQIFLVWLRRSFPPLRLGCRLGIIRFDLGTLMPLQWQDSGLHPSRKPSWSKDSWNYSGLWSTNWLANAGSIRDNWGEDLNLVAQILYHDSAMLCHVFLEVAKEEYRVLEQGSLAKIVWNCILFEFKNYVITRTIQSARSLGTGRIQTHVSPTRIGNTFLLSSSHGNFSCMTEIWAVENE